MALLGPDDIYLYALRAIPKVTWKYPVADEVQFARVLVALSYEESCRDKNAEGQVCFNSDARPVNKNGKRLSSALGLTQMLEGTQPWVEALMGWPERPLDDRSDPQYAEDLAAAYLAYLYNGGMKVPRGDWYKALVAYHDGHYSKGGAGNSYARTVIKYLKRFDFAEIARRNASTIAALEFINRGEFR
ncbi:MAG TPA: transglycosylase SLT domain-containing protein [Candidatus Kapabacteria bacterium]|nr:transglycosylase SLT domain-containing protein [Candidatus Kapabacteria bacterium]